MIDPKYHSSLPALVKFTCGCIGFHPDPVTGVSLLLSYCDTSESEPYYIGVRNMHGKGFGSVDKDRAAEIFNKLGSLVDDGHAYSELSVHLGRALSCS